MNTSSKRKLLHEIAKCWINDKKSHCVISVRIRSYSGPHFPGFGLNTERNSVSLHLYSECRKMRSE